MAKQIYHLVVDATGSGRPRVISCHKNARAAVAAAKKLRKRNYLATISTMKGFGCHGGRKAWLSK